MPLISQVGRKSLKSRFAFLLLYLFLTLGALTMIYPFTLMLSNSFTSFADFKEYKLIPAYFLDSQCLFKKYIVDKLKTEMLGLEYGFKWYQPVDIQVKKRIIDVERSVLDEDYFRKTGVKRYSKTVYKTLNPLGKFYNIPQENLNKIVDDWKSFLPTVAPIHKLLYFRDSGESQWSPLDMKPEYHKWLEKRFSDISELNNVYDENAEFFHQIHPPNEDPLRQRWLLPLDAKTTDWQNFKSEQPFHRIFVISAELAFQKYLREIYPLLTELEKATEMKLADHSDLTLAKAVSTGCLPKEKLDYFIRKRCPVVFLHLDKSLETDFYGFLKSKYSSAPENVKATKLKIAFTELCPMDDTGFTGRANEWIDFMEQKAPLEKISFNDPTINYQNCLEKKYGTIEKLNATYATNYSDFKSIRLPSPYIDVYAFRENKRSVFLKYFTGNYMMVMKVIVVHGRALVNTIIYILLSILGTLTVNPLAAYAISRYRLPYTNKILLFLLATMAFPPAVGMIPRFLLIKDLGLLNTFGALVLPGLANGYGIFLLKGFFDSLPQELYEAAAIDGASEFSMFLRMTLPMTKPILAIMTLNAFTSAYSAFMFAFLTCQDPKMWTLMVFLYEFQQTYPNYLVMASLVVAAIPTLIVFIFCQNIILRGIVIPSFK